MRCITVKTVLVGSLFLFVGFSAAAQQIGTSPTTGDSVAQLQQELKQTQQQLATSQAEISDLRSMVEELQKQFASLKRESPKNVAGIAPEQPAGKANQAEISGEEWQLLNAKVEEHQQVKVESGSKFKLKLSGMVLLNVFGTAGSVDQIDLPGTALPRPPAASDGNFGASLRQSLFALTGTGPELLGARTSADLQVDFFGGIPHTYAGYASGIARLRLARARFDWDSTSMIAGLDVPFFSPNSPTSYVSVAEPALSSAGNLWTWTPQVRIEQRFDSARSQLKIEGGILDYAGYTGYYQDYRYPTPGESSRQPAYAVRLSVNGKNEDRPVAVGIAGLYAPQRFPFGNDLSGWAGMMDWKFPVLPRTELSGELFVGQGISGFGGVSFGIQQSQSYQYMAVSALALARFQTIGGWSQLKYKFNSRSEVNVAAGYGGLDSESLRDGGYTNTDLTIVPARNQTLLTNYVLRPRSDLVFSLEYRHLRTFRVSGAPLTADHVGVSAGFIF